MNPLVLLLLLPILELAVMIEVGGWIGGWPTVGLLVLAGIAGSLILRHRGLAVLRRAQEALDRGELPVGAVFEGFCVVAGAILLIIPGFITDVVAILLLLPFPRDAIGRWLLDRMRASGSLRVWMNRTESGPPGARQRETVIDVDYREVEPDAPRIEDSRWGSDRERKP